ncbi:RND transporter [Solimonas sp. K1W22B-7]|uniref:efflux RND transporter permease subunit n=1 Tax=Solimonas sp. K1W22B-7 TaxID=2303331 RepID=UPI000E333CEA|nr:MMPL family transporter [Solimonas sp. K1W22B-7]AXQ31071.1 RND transporter [Solimonas sp. K1W22B-7]
MNKQPFRFRLAKLIMDNRGLFAALFVLVTLAFMAGIPRVEIRTIFKDLLPKNDPFVQVYYDHPNFGNPLAMAIMIKRKDGGNIYNPETLQKVWQLTRDIDLAPGVDHDQIISVSTEKLRFAEATPYGIDMRPLMDDHVPSTPDEVREFRRRIEQSPNARTFFVSGDETATLIKATFLDSIEYGEAFKYANDLIEKARDDKHEVYLAGEPVLTGWVYKLQKQTYFIFAVTIGLLLAALLFYMRNLAGVVTPVICATVAALWGFGFIGWLGRPIEPLLMIVPLLLVARTLSHCIQYTERYYEILTHVKNKRKAAEITMGVMMAPSVLGIMTDVFGIILIALAPIETMINHALFCGAWALWIIPTGVFLISILLSYLPEPKNIENIAGGAAKEKGIHLFQKNALDKLSRLTFGPAAKYTTIGAVILAVFAIYETLQIKIGNPVEGSNLLWFDSEYNTAVRAINAHFPGMNTLEIVLEAKKRDPNNRVARTPDVAAVSAQIQAIVESDPVMPPRATLSFTDYMMEGNRLFSGGNPKWLPLDPTMSAVRAAGTAVTFGTNPVNFGHISDFEFQNSTISLWYKDSKQETVDAALASAKRAVEAVGTDHPDFTVRMASGSIALQQAMNNVVHEYHWFILGLLNVILLVISAYAYRSIVAGIILLIPVNMSNFLLMAAMHLLGVGLDINAVIVAVMGVGVGIDYGIYMLSRICEEFSAHDKDWGRAITASMTTTGKAIMFTASIMLLGIVPWYFMSDLKFMADMGILLIAIMLVNMVLSLVVLPLLCWLIKPSFASREDLAVGESIDLSQFDLGNVPEGKLATSS